MSTKVQSPLSPSNRYSLKVGFILDIIWTSGQGILINKYNHRHYSQMMTWFEMYSEFIKNLEKVNQLQRDFITNLERINYLYNESIKSIEKVNDLYNQSIRNYENMNRSYEQHFENMQRMNQKWLDVFSKSWGQQQQNEKH